MPKVNRRTENGLILPAYKTRLVITGVVRVHAPINPIAGYLQFETHGEIKVAVNHYLDKPPKLVVLEGLLKLWHWRRMKGMA